MTIDEHMCMKTFIMDVRDEIQDRFRRDERMRLLVDKLEYCLTVLRRPHIVHALTDTLDTELTSSHD